MRRGLTLIEVIVTLVLLGVILAVVSASPMRTQGGDADWRGTLRRARHDAITSGRPVHGYTDTLGLFTALPDGSLLLDLSTPLGSGGTRAP